MAIFDVRSWESAKGPRDNYKVSAPDMWAALAMVKALYPRKPTGFCAYHWHDVSSPKNAKELTE